MLTQFQYSVSRLKNDSFLAVKLPPGHIKKAFFKYIFLLDTPDAQWLFHFV